MTTSHPSPELLMRLAAGTLRPAAALVVETHLAMCPQCRSERLAMEALGGVLLDSMNPSEVDARLFERTLERLDEARPANGASHRAPRVVPELGIPLPPPLAGRATTGWRWMGPGMAFSRIAVPDDPSAKLILLKIAPGRRMPTHGHSGEELTLVLKGAFEDEHGRYGPGDLAEEDGDSEHTPMVTGTEDCICLASIEGTLRPHSMIARLVQPFIGL